MCSMETPEVDDRVDLSLRKSMQSRLRQTLIRRFDVLDRRDVGTSKLLSVPLIHRVGREVSNSSRTSCSFLVIDSALKMFRQDVHPPEILAKRSRLSTLAWSERAVASFIAMNTRVLCINSTVTDAFWAGSEIA